MPKKIKTKWESTEKNPDEEMLKALFKEESDSQQASFAQEEKSAKGRKEDLDLLIRASGRNERELIAKTDETARHSKEAAKEAQRTYGKSTVNFEELHKKDIAQAKEIDKNSEGRNPNPSWYGYLWNSTYGGWWSSWNGEAEEVPSASISPGADRIDPRAQSWGEGWFDSDFSQIHAYLGFQFRSPSWGHLHVYVYPWAHGYYSLYSNDTWYNSEYARAEFDTWVDLYQNFWRGRQYRRRFTLAGDELHPTRSGRIDSQFSHLYSTNIGEGDTVTIRVGARLYCRAKASGSHSILNFRVGNANYLYVPYVYWYLHH
jgi:hypothetical protein